jgi:FolB domain-containing protein
MSSLAGCPLDEKPKACYSLFNREAAGANMDQIFITDLRARGIIGVNDWEREVPQDILINIAIFTDLEIVGQSDNLEDSVSYSTIAKQVLTIAENAKRFTLESLASDIAAHILKNDRIQKVVVRVEKPGAVRFARSVGVEIDRSRIDTGD